MRGASAFASAVQAECLRRGPILELGGRHGCVVRFLPPLVIDERQPDRVFDIFASALRAAAGATAVDAGVASTSRPAAPMS